MKIIYNKILPFKGYRAMMLFGTIFARSEYKPLPQSVINHENIHYLQAQDCGCYLWFYLLYIYYSCRYGYKNNPFEREAYANQNVRDYIFYREQDAWKKYKL
jgi:hypothetical protein